jgi:membrane protease YdiL (CAAX protease family)
MLPEKPWRADAVFRLFVSVLICAVFIGALVGSFLAYVGNHRHSHWIAFLACVLSGLGLVAVVLVLLDRHWPLESFPRNALILLICFNGALLISWQAARWSGSEDRTEPSAARVLVTLLGVQAVSLFLVKRFLSAHGMSWNEAFEFRWGWRRSVLIGAGMALLFLPVGWGLQLGSGMLMQLLHLQPHEQEAVELLRGPEALASRCVLGAAAILTAPVVEEMLFRGILYPAIRRAGFHRLAWWGSAMAFGAVHLNLATFVPLTALALILVWLYENTGNLLAPVVAHSVFNAMNFALLWVEQSRLTPGGSG